MKKLFIILSCFILLFSFDAIALTSPVTDNADILTDEEEAKLHDTLFSIRNTYDIDVSVFTENDIPQGGAQNRADSIYDTLGYGSGDRNNGILFYISMGERSYAFTTTGQGITIFDDTILYYMEEAILPYLQGGDYFSAFNEYAKEAIYALDNYGEEAYAYDKQHYEEYGYYPGEAEISYSLTETLPVLIGISIILSLIVAFIFTLIRVAMMKTAKSNDQAENYIKQGSFKLTDSRDIFLYSNIRKTPKPKPQNSSGVHRSASSSRSHGGRSGRF